MQRILVCLFVFCCSCSGSKKLPFSTELLELEVKLLDCPSTSRSINCNITVRNHDDQWYYIDPAAIVIGYGSENENNIAIEYTGLFRNKADSAFYSLAPKSERQIILKTISVAKFKLTQDSLYFCSAVYQPFYGEQVKNGMKRIDFRLHADTIQFRASAPLPESQQSKRISE